MLGETLVAIAVLALTVGILVLVARFTPGGAGVPGGPRSGTPEEVREAVEAALEE